MLEVLEKDGGEAPKSPTQMPGNLQMHVDIYKHHWDLFLKGFAAYLAACALFATFATGTTTSPPTIFQKLFAGGAVIGASLVATLGLAISLTFLNDILRSIDSLCERYGYEKINFTGPRQILQLFRRIAGLMLFIGVLYLIHLFVFDNAWEQLTALYAKRWR